jgi:hypothetical protein
MRNNSITCLLALSFVLAACLGVEGMTSFPANIRVPDGHTFAVSYFAAGFQIYRCNVSAGSWVLNRPEADLWPSKIGHDLNEARVGYHRFVDGRPTWYTVSGAGPTRSRPHRWLDYLIIPPCTCSEGLPCDGLASDC